MSQEFRTVNGAIVFDDRYIGKPLVYCGTVGIMPSEPFPTVRASHIKTPSAGDIVYMVGGRVGYDGIHGATFSSLELTEESPSSACSDWRPLLLRRKMLDMVLEARDAGLISCITDNGAGGLSSSIGEMAEYTNGCEIDLSASSTQASRACPLGKSWFLKSQERMTVAVKPEDCKLPSRPYGSICTKWRQHAVATFTNQPAYVPCSSYG